MIGPNGAVDLQIIVNKLYADVSQGNVRYNIATKADIDQALAKVTRDNQLVTLTASRDLRFLLQEVLEKQMTSRGYMIGPNGAVDLQIIVNKLYADVSQGNVRYNIATKADIAIIATAANGTKMTKNYRASYSVEGAFQASNKNIADAVNSVLTDTIADMAQDTSIHDFIKQNAR